MNGFGFRMLAAFQHKLLKGRLMNEEKPVRAEKMQPSDSASTEVQHPVVILASQWVVRTHGQGRINLEIVRALRAKQIGVAVVAADCESGVDARWSKINVSGRLPTNWARGEVFRRWGGSAVKRLATAGRDTPFLISNGAAVPQSGDLNLAMFVHAAWLKSKWHPRFGRGWHGKYQGLYNAVHERLEKEAFRNARRVVALSDVVRDELVEHIGMHREQIDVIPPGVDPTEFHPPTNETEASYLRKACGIRGPRGEKPVVVMFAGEIRSNRKNLDLVLDAVAAVPDVHLAVAGDTKGSPYPAIAVKLGIERTRAFPRVKARRFAVALSRRGCFHISVSLRALWPCRD